MRFSSGEPGCERAASETMVRSRSTAEPSGLGAAATTEKSMALRASRDKAEAGSSFIEKRSGR